MAYKIKSGDTLSALAKQWGTSVAEIMKANPQIKNANKISAGATLTRPGGTSSASSSSGVTSNYNNPAGTAVLNNPNASLADLIAQVKTATGSATDSYVRPDNIDVADPRLLSIGELEDALGMDYTYDREEIEAILNAATQAEYDVRYGQQGVAERGYYKGMATAQDTALDMLRQQDAMAIQQGVSKGMQSANMLATILGTSQTASDEATALAQERQLLGKEHGAALAKNQADALSQSNAAFESAGGLSRQLFADMVNQRAADLEYNASLNTDYATYLSNKYSADSGLLSSIAQAGSGVYNNNQASLAQIEQSIQNAAAQRYAADQQYAATLAAARYGGSSGGSGGGGSSNGFTELPTPNTYYKASADNPSATATGAARAEATARTAAIRAAQQVKAPTFGIAPLPKNAPIAHAGTGNVTSAMNTLAKYFNKKK